MVEKTRQVKRKEYERKRRKKFLKLKNTKNLSNYYKQNKMSTTKEIKKFEKDIIKAGEFKQNKIMAKKLLFILPADKPWARVARRGIVIFALAGLSVVFQDVLANQGQYIPSVWLPLLIALGAMIDKSLREFTGK